jgi:enoyl-CoA hydratase/carnithine racemase
MALVAAETRGAVGLAQLDRPDARNALSPELMEELASLCERWDEDPALRCIVIAGGDRWFAAGADIKAMAKRTFAEALTAPSARFWPRLAALRTPLVAAVSGYALGGGCELALACDMIVASETAEFGQPETGLGIIPGAGGTQRLTRAVGKAVAMDVILSGRRLSAQEALQAGLVARVVPADQWLEGAKSVARDIAEKGPVATRLAKESVDRAYETTLAAGLEAERRALYLAFASEDAREGLQAFTEKRKPEFKGS